MPIDYGPEPTDVGSSYSLESLQSIDVDSSYIDRTNGIEPIRREALMEAALEVGAQGGLLSQSMEINAFLESTKDGLDRQFPFYPLLIDGEILPPVILESRQAVTSSDDGRTMRVADATYKIKSDARFVSAAPTWRDYLFMDQQGIMLPHKSVAPETGAEKKLWFEMVKKGWRSGVQQADQIYDLALNDLRQDYVGMVTYRKLLAEGKVSKPEIERNNLGVTGSGREMVIGDRVKQITIDSALQVDKSYEWKAPVLPDEKPAIISNGKSMEDIRIEVVKTNSAIGSKDVRSTLFAWMTEWESGDVDDYLSFYANDFMLPEGVSRSAWEAGRRASIERTKKIDVGLTELKVVISEDSQHASVNFNQRYEFDQYRGSVDKLMLLELNEYGEWRIAYEAESSPRRASR